MNDEEFEISWWIFSAILGSVAAGVATVYWMLT